MAKRVGDGDQRPPPPRQFHNVPPPFALYCPPSSPFDPLHFPPHVFSMPAPVPPSSDTSSSVTNHPIQAQLFVPLIPRDLFLEREKERERIRDEIMREEARRRIIEEEVRKEMEMERKSKVRDSFGNPNCVNGPCSCNCMQLQLNEERRRSEEQSLPKDSTENYSDGNKGKAQLGENKDQCEKGAEIWGAKRKVENLPITNTEEAGPAIKRIKAKKQKCPPKEFNCELCQLTLRTEGAWMGHINGKKHRNKVKKACVDYKPNLKETLEEKNADEKLKHANLKEVSFEKEGASAIQPINKKILVKGEMQERVVKNDRFFCEPCRFNCSTTMMMEIHLSSDKHKANCEKGINETENLLN